MLWLLLLIFVVIIFCVTGGADIRKVHVGPVWLQQIREGKKTIDIRAGSNKEFTEKELLMNNNSDAVHVKVLKVNHYNSLQDLVDAEDYKLIMADADSAASVVAALEKYFPPARIEAAGGICALHVKVDEKATAALNVDGPVTKAKSDASKEKAVDKKKKVSLTKKK